MAAEGEDDFVEHGLGNRLVTLEKDNITTQEMAYS